MQIQTGATELRIQLRNSWAGATCEGSCNGNGVKIIFHFILKFKFWIVWRSVWNWKFKERIQKPSSNGNLLLSASNWNHFFISSFHNDYNLIFENLLNFFLNFFLKSLLNIEPFGRHFQSMVDDHAISIMKIRSSIINFSIIENESQTLQTIFICGK